MSKTQLNVPVVALEVPNASLYRLAGDARQALALEKTLKVLQYPALNACAIQIDVFKYSLSPEIPFLRHGIQLFYTFPDVDTYFGLEFSPDTPTDMVEKFEEIVNANAYFTASIYEIEEPQKMGNEGTKGTAETISSYITSSAKFIKSAFVRTAEVASKGVKKSGDYITSKVAKNPEPAKIGSKTKTVVHGTKVTTDKVVEVKDRTVLLR